MIQDKGAKDWLGGYLSRYSGTLLVVSHDEPLLKAAVSSIAEVRGGTIELVYSLYFFTHTSLNAWLVLRSLTDFSIICSTRAGPMSNGSWRERKG